MPRLPPLLLHLHQFYTCTANQRLFVSWVLLYIARVLEARVSCRYP